MADKGKGGFARPGDGEKSQRYWENRQPNWRERLAEWMYPDGPIPPQAKNALGVGSPSSERIGAIDLALLPTLLDVGEEAYRGNYGAAARYGIGGVVAPYAAGKAARYGINKAMRGMDFAQQYPYFAGNIRYGTREMEGPELGWQLKGNMSQTLGKPDWSGRFQPSPHMDELERRASKRAAFDLPRSEQWLGSEVDILDAFGREQAAMRGLSHDLMAKGDSEIAKSDKLFGRSAPPSETVPLGQPMPKPGKPDPNEVDMAMRRLRGFQNFNEAAPPPRNMMNSLAPFAVPGGFLMIPRSREGE